LVGRLVVPNLNAEFKMLGFNKVNHLSQGGKKETLGTTTP